jgi:hypothetical protein
VKRADRARQPIMTRRRARAPVVLIAITASSEVSRRAAHVGRRNRKNFNVSTYLVGPSTGSKDFGSEIARSPRPAWW